MYYKISNLSRSLIKFISILIIVIMFSISCEKSTCPDNDDHNIAEKFEIHLQTHFNNTHVFIRIDGKNIFSGEVSTNYVIGLAAIISPQISKGTHEIETFVQGFESDTTFLVQDTLLIGIRYDDSSEEISYHFYKPPNFPIYE